MNGPRARAEVCDIAVVVEDHEDTQEVTAELLELEGHAVMAYPDAESALHAIRRMQAPPCIVILDFRLPGMSGGDFVRELRDDPVLAGVPVIVTSGGPYEPVAQLGLKYLVKPFDPEVLLSVVRQHCRAYDADGDA
jgi:DNA-binding response OmpR family regulator